MSDPTPENPTEPVLEPATWYAVTARCETETCSNHHNVTELPEVYSNAGHDVRVLCHPCQADMLILTAVRLDPQPEFA